MTAGLRPAWLTPALLAVLDALSEGVLLTDTAFNPLAANAALKALAYAEGLKADAGLEALRTLFHERCFVPEQIAVLEEAQQKAPDAPRTDVVRLERPAQVLKRYAAPLRDEAGERVGFLVSYQDVTRDVTLEQARGEFIANASHELRTPVTSVKLILENLVDGAKDDLRVRDDFLDDALAEIERMHALVNDLLDLATLESGKSKLELAPVSLAGLIADALETVMPQAESRQVEVFWEAPADLAVRADARRLRQVLVNLVTNGVKFTPAGGTVSVSAARDGAWATIAVRDSGIGIPAADLPHLFDRFYRVTRGRARLSGGGGTGLGLTIVKEAVDAHGGRITVESTEGAGSAFHVYLPLDGVGLEGASDHVG